MLQSYPSLIKTGCHSEFHHDSISVKNTGKSFNSIITIETSKYVCYLHWDLSSKGACPMRDKL